VGDEPTTILHYSFELYEEKNQLPAALNVYNDYAGVWELPTIHAVPSHIYAKVSLLKYALKLITSRRFETCGRFRFRYRSSLIF